MAYANAGVATNALATLVVVTWYLEDDSRPGSELERDAFVKTLTTGVRSAGRDVSSRRPDPRRRRRPSATPGAPDEVPATRAV